MPCTYLLSQIYATQEESQINIIGECMLDNESGYENPVRMVGIKTGNGWAYAKYQCKFIEPGAEDFTSVLKTYSEMI